MAANARKWRVQDEEPSTEGPHEESTSDQVSRLRIVQGGPPEAAQATCRERGCENVATTGDYCRAHYIKNWHLIKRREEILRRGDLDTFIGDMVRRYPVKTLQAIRADLASDESFDAVMREMDLPAEAEETAPVDPIDELSDSEGEESDLIEGVKTGTQGNEDY